MSDTNLKGYRMRTQIAKALKSRSKAVKTAVTTYNEAAQKLGRPVLELKSVLDYVHLGQFDLLRLSRHNITEKPWARPAEREAATAYFKLKRSHEELARVEIEMKRLIKGIYAYKAVVTEEIRRLQDTDKLLAWQLNERYKIRQAQDDMHLRRIRASRLAQYLDGELFYITLLVDVLKIRPLQHQYQRNIFMKDTSRMTSLRVKNMSQTWTTQWRHSHEWRFIMGNLSLLLYLKLAMDLVRKIVEGCG